MRKEPDFEQKEMKSTKRNHLFVFFVSLCSFLAVILCASHLHAAELIVDRAITIHSTREVTEKRRALIEYLWGSNGFPKGLLPTTVVTNIDSPVKQLTDLARVDELRMDLRP